MGSHYFNPIVVDAGKCFTTLIPTIDVSISIKDMAAILLAGKGVTERDTGWSGSKAARDGYG